MKFVVYLFVTLLFLGSLAFAATAGIYAYYAQELPDYTQLDRRTMFQTSRIVDRNGKLLAEINDPQGGRRTLVALSEVPAALRDATIAAEDASFYENPGFDPRAVVRALYQNFRGQRIVSGASTITQQLVKNTMLSPELTAERKIKEALLAIELTRRYSKNKILEMYLNEIYYGNLAYGVEAAAQTYFGKTARELDLAEASFLAGLPQAPALYDPYTDPIAARERQNYVLDQMEQRGFASATAVHEARTRPLVVRPADSPGATQAPHFVVFVRQWLEQRFSSELLYRAGLEIQTSLDLDLQQLAERAARDQISVIRERNASNAALVSIQPETGELLAMVGSLNFSDPQIDGQVNVAVRPRQPGSTLKPFTYLASFAKGWSPATVIMDTPTAFGGTYRPNNFDNKFRGPVRVRQALAQSLNIPAVKALDFVGVGDLVSSVHRFGINGLRDPQRYGLSVTLGGGEVSLLDLTYAYQVLANSGNQSGAAVLESERQPGFRELEPIVVLKVTDSTGKVVYQAQPGRKALADPHLTYLITHILADDEARAPTYGRNSPLQLTRPAAVKTGTTDDFHDSWVVGYTPDLLTGIWVGNSDGSPMRDVFGAQGAGRIFNAFMEAALSGKPPRPFARPNGIVERQVCALSGLLATPDCPEKVVELFAPSQVPTKQDDVFKRLDICLINGKLATEHVPPNARESRVFALFPEPMRAWGLQNGYAAPPSERCDDVYRGIKRAEFAGPPPGSPLRGTVQIVGTALMDDLRSYDLEAGTGLNPAQWIGVTMGRQQGVDNALLGVWDTSAVDPGLYTLRLTLHDGVGNTHQARTQVVVSPSGTPTALPSPNPLGVPATLGLPRPIPTPDVAPTAGPAADAEATRTRPPGASPTVTPSRR